MARPTPLPTVPAGMQALRGDHLSEPWIQFHQKMLDMLKTLTQLGTRAEQPAATSVYEGTLYFVTDELVTERSNGNTWDPYSA